MAPTPEQRRLREEQERVAATVLRFLRARATFFELIGDGQEARQPRFSEVDAFVQGQLFELKEECHWLFRSRERADAVEAGPALTFDILVGSLFHQMLKAKENCYQVERYGTKYAELRKALEGQSSAKQSEAFLEEGERIISRARDALPEEYSHARELFLEATLVLRQVLVENRENPILVRALVENEELLEAAYKRGALEALFREMYENHPATGFVMAAVDFLDGGWFGRARELCRRAQALDPESKAAAELLDKTNRAANAHLG